MLGYILNGSAASDLQPQDLLAALTLEDLIRDGCYLERSYSSQLPAPSQDVC